MNKKVRQATTFDEPQIQKILENRLQSMAPAEHSQFNWNKQTLKEELEFAQVWILETAEVGESKTKNEPNHADVSPKPEIKAFLCFRLSPEAYEITILTTDPSSARQGNQTTLIAKIKQLAEAEKKQIWLEVHAKNTAALELYKKNGFTISGTRTRYYKDGNDAILMTLNFTQA